jgi:hypothetical protein
MYRLSQLCTNHMSAAVAAATALPQPSFESETESFTIETAFGETRRVTEAEKLALKAVCLR